jgi:hypothetical protein
MQIIKVRAFLLSHGLAYFELPQLGDDGRRKTHHYQKRCHATERSPERDVAKNIKNRKIFP